MWLNKIEFVLERVENILGKGENAGYLKVPAFPPFPKTLSKASFFRVVKSRDCLVKTDTKVQNVRSNTI